MKTNLKDIYQQWQHNSKFRAEFKLDPLLALKNAGFEVSAEDLIKIKSTFKMTKSKNEELDKRISK